MLHRDEFGVLVETEVSLDAFGAQVAAVLVERDSTFTRHHVLTAVSQMLRPTASIAALERLTRLVLAQHHLVPLPAPDGPSALGWEQRWTSRHLLDLETELLGCFGPTHTDVAALDPTAVTRELAAPALSSLGPDQADMVRKVTTQGLAVEVVVGRAGTGKTYAMAAVRDLYDRAGYQLIGVAPSALAARGLGEGAGIDAVTFPRFKLKIADTLTPRHVVVIDEAGMAGTVDLHHVVTTARQAGAKVILVGDHHQLPEITAGGGFAAAVAANGRAIAELTTNRRQHHQWERDALDELRAGDVPAAFHAYQAHDRVHLHDTIDAVHTAAINDWWSAYRAGRDALLLAGTRVEAKALNRDGRARAATAGLLSGPVLTVGERTFQAGDRVILTRNHGFQFDLDRQQRCRVDNGMIGTVDAVYTTIGVVDIRLTTGRHIRLDGRYVEDGNVDHGYAVTIHKSQGVTCDDVFVVGPRGLYQQAGYVAMSRARAGAHLYATSTDAATLGERPHTSGIPLPSEPADDPETNLIDALEQSAAKLLASHIAPHLAEVADTATHSHLDELWARNQHIRHVIRTLEAAGHRNPTTEAERLARARTHRAYLHTGGRVRALDWDNVGTVIADRGAHRHRLRPLHSTRRPRIDQVDALGRHQADRPPRPRRHHPRRRGVLRPRRHRHRPRNRHLASTPRRSRDRGERTRRHPRSHRAPPASTRPPPRR